jgi:uncharacterized repeat protein (TIGR03809 family)
MTERPAFREFGKTAERWRDLAEQRREYFAELYRSGRWHHYYTEDQFRARVRLVAEICDRWVEILEQHRQVVAECAALAANRDTDWVLETPALIPQARIHDQRPVLRHSAR